MICCLSMAALGTTTYLTRFDDQSLSSNLDSALRWLSLVFLITFVLGFTLGLGPVPWILVGELKPGKNTSVNKSMKWKLYVFSSFRLYQVAWGRLWTSHRWSLIFFKRFLFTMLLSDLYNGLTFLFNGGLDLCCQKQPLYHSGHCPWPVNLWHCFRGFSYQKTSERLLNKSKSKPKQRRRGLVISSICKWANDVVTNFKFSLYLSLSQSLTVNWV